MRITSRIGVLDRSRAGHGAAPCLLPRTVSANTPKPPRPTGRGPRKTDHTLRTTTCSLVNGGQALRDAGWRVFTARAVYAVAFWPSAKSRCGTRTCGVLPCIRHAQKVRSTVPRAALTARGQAASATAHRLVPAEPGRVRAVEFPPGGGRHQPVRFRAPGSHVDGARRDEIQRGDADGGHGY